MNKIMSYITNVMLFIGGFEEEEQRLEEVNTFLRLLGTSGLVPVTNKNLPEVQLGGNKVFVHGLYIGAYNYFPLDAFIEHLNDITWEHPQNIQIFVLDEDNLIFRVMKLVN